MYVLTFSLIFFSSDWIWASMRIRICSLNWNSLSSSWSDFFYYGNTWNGKIWFSNVKKMPYANFIFFAIWIPSSNVYLLRFDTKLEKNIAGDICKIAKKYLPHFANGYILPFHFFAMIKEITSGILSFSSSCCTSAIFDVFKLFFKLTFAWLSLIQTWVWQDKRWFSIIEYNFWDLQSTL